MTAKQSEVQSATTDFQAIVAELDRRLATQTGRYHLCPDRLCRRLRRCAGADMPCARDAMSHPVSRNDEWRLKRAIKHSRKRG